MFGAAPAVGAGTELALYLNSEVAVLLGIGIVASLPVFPAVRALALGKRWQGLPAVQTGLALARVSLYIGVFSLALLWLASGTHNPFIYFRF
jgi:alginate O-acetyltransferase complex protein AlgI